MNENFLGELPLGFSMALAKNPDALQSFGNLSEMQRNEILKLAQNATSKSEMQQIVNQIL